MDVIDLKTHLLQRHHQVRRHRRDHEPVSDRVSTCSRRPWATIGRSTSSSPPPTKRAILIKIAKREGFETFYIPDGVGGRFSELSPVGLLAAAVMRHRHPRHAGRRRAPWTSAAQTDDVWKNPALLEAVLMVHRHAGQGHEHVRDDALCRQPEAAWPTGTAQLWAESLGKNVTLRRQARATSVRRPSRRWA